MKIQDVAFFALSGLLISFKKPQLFIWAGLVCLALSIPLFAGWIFFSAQRLTWYAAAFFGMFIVTKL